MSTSRLALVACPVLVFASALFWASAAPDAPPPPPPPGAHAPGPPRRRRDRLRPPRRVRGVLQEHQVLKGARGWLIPMQFISASSGGLRFRHVEHAPEKGRQGREEVTARDGQDERARSTRTTSRDTARSRATPVIAVPTVRAGSPRSRPATGADSEETAEAELPTAEVFDKYLRTSAAPKRSARSRGQKGTLSGFGLQPFPIEVRRTRIAASRPVHTDRGDNITALRRQEWLAGNTGRPPRDMSPGERSRASTRTCSSPRTSPSSIRSSGSGRATRSTARTRSASLDAPRGRLRSTSGSTSRAGSSCASRGIRRRRSA
jgi:hypothetical protein